MQFVTNRGAVTATIITNNNWHVRTDADNTFLGAVTETWEGEYIASPGDSRGNRRFDSLRSAVRHLGER